jgi:hypothetical protein
MAGRFDSRADLVFGSVHQSAYVLVVRSYNQCASGYRDDEHRFEVRVRV